MGIKAGIAYGKGSTIRQESLDEVNNRLFLSNLAQLVLETADLAFERRTRVGNHLQKESAPRRSAAALAAAHRDKLVGGIRWLRRRFQLLPLAEPTTAGGRQSQPRQADATCGTQEALKSTRPGDRSAAHDALALGRRALLPSHRRKLGRVALIHVDRKTWPTSAPGGEKRRKLSGRPGADTRADRPGRNLWQ